MEIKTSTFGNQIIDPDTIITFPLGIPGFEDSTQYKLFHQQDSGLIYWLQSLDDESLAFSIAHPAHFNIDYCFELSESEQATLAAEHEQDLVIMIILYEDENIEESVKPPISGAVKSPLIINSKNRTGLQKTLVNLQQSITLTENKATH